MKMKRILSVLTALTVIAAPCPSAFAEGINRTYSSVGTESETLKKKMENTAYIFRNPAYYIYVEKMGLIFLKWNWSCQRDKS